jgi:hypothetical protein
MPGRQQEGQLSRCCNRERNWRRSLPLVHSPNEGTLGMELLKRVDTGVTGSVRAAGLPPPLLPPYFLTHFFASACTSSIALSACSA